MTFNCPECGGKILVRGTSITKYGKYKQFQCKSCNFKHSISGSNVDNLTPEQILANGATKRRISDADAIAIRESSEPRKQLAAQYGISIQMVRSIQIGEVYRDLLPGGFRRPPGPNDPSCVRCREWRNDECLMGFPDPQIEGVGFACDCSLYVVEG